MSVTRPALLATLLVLAISVPLRADNIDYSVGNYAPATIKVAGDGTIFVDYVAPVAGETYAFDLYLWVESGGAVPSFPTAECPIDFKKLSGFDATSWFAADPTPVSFDGYGTDPSPRAPDPRLYYTGLPGGSYRAVRITFTIPAAGLEEDLVQVKIKAATARVRFLGEGHGVIVRLARGPSETFRISSWLTDSAWLPMSDPSYGDNFSVVTRNRSLDVVATNPGGFYYNVLVVTTAPIADLTVVVDPIPADFGLWGANSTHVYVGEVDVTDPAREAAIPLGHALAYELHDVPAGTPVFMTVHVRYTLTRLPSTLYLPRVYTFSSGATGDGVSAASSASMTATKKR